MKTKDEYFNLFEEQFEAYVKESYPSGQLTEMQRLTVKEVWTMGMVFYHNTVNDVMYIFSSWGKVHEIRLALQDFSDKVVMERNALQISMMSTYEETQPAEVAKQISKIVLQTQN